MGARRMAAADSEDLLTDATGKPREILDTFRLDGRVALVTGGARGLGLTMATALAEVGADIAISGRTQQACQEAVAQITKDTGRRAVAFNADVTKAADVEKLAADVEASLGKIDILINNAGINIRGPIQDLSEADWDAVLDTNLKGPWLCAKAIGPRMVARGWGRMINIGSILSVIAMPGRTPYASSKAGVPRDHTRAGARMGRDGRDGQRDLPRRVRHGVESSVDERPREVQRVRRADPDGPLGRSARDRRRRGVPGVGRLVCT